MRRTAFAAVIAMSLALSAIVLMQGGFSTVGALRVVEVIGLAIVAGAALLGLMAIVGLRLAGWSEPESEAEAPPGCSRFAEERAEPVHLATVGQLGGVSPFEEGAGAGGARTGRAGRLARRPARCGVPLGLVQPAAAR